MDPLDLRRVTQFLCVAEKSSFTAAAAELHLSQQAVSSAVKQLERDLGVALVDRGGRRVRLTAAGTALHVHAKPLLAAADVLRRRVRAAAATPEPFVVAHTPAVTGEEVSDLVAPLRGIEPSVSVTVREMFPDAMRSALLDGSVDIGLRRGVATPQDLSAAVVGYDRIRVALGAGHRLSSRRRLTIAELAHERIVVWAPPGASFYTDFLFGICRRAGFEPDYVVNPVQGTPPVTAVVDTDAVAFVTAPAGQALNGRVVVVDLVDPPLVPTQALWLPHTVSALRDRLLADQPLA